MSLLYTILYIKIEIYLIYPIDIYYIACSFINFGFNLLYYTINLNNFCIKYIPAIVLLFKLSMFVSSFDLRNMKRRFRNMWTHLKLILRLLASTPFMSFKGVNAVSGERYPMPAGFSMRGSLEWELRSSFKSEPTWSVLSRFVSVFCTSKRREVFSSTICNVILLT